MKPGSRDPAMRFALALIDCLLDEDTEVTPELLFSKDLLFDLDDFVGRAAPEALEAEGVRTYVLKLLESGAFSAWNQLSKIKPEEANGLDFSEVTWKDMQLLLLADKPYDRFTVR